MIWLLGRCIFVIGIFGIFGGGSIIAVWILLIAVAAADLIVRRVGVTSAARPGVVSAILAVQHSVTTLALSVVVHGRATAVRVRPERAVAKLSVAAHLAGLVFLIVLVSAARVILPVDDRLSAARGVTTVLPLHDRLVAALVRVVVVELVSTAAGVLAVRAFLQRAVAAGEVPVVVGRLATAATVAVVGLGTGDAAAADMRVGVVRIVATAAGVAAVLLSLQLSAATDVVVTVVDFPATTAVRRPLVNAVPTAAAVGAVGPVADAFALTTDMGARRVRFTAAAASVSTAQGLDSAAAASVVSPVVGGAVAASRVRTVIACAHAYVIVRHCRTGP